MEKHLSSQEEIAEKYFKVGIVVFVFNNNGEVLIVQETRSNEMTGKLSEDYGTICETSEAGEGWEDTLIRSFKEELGIDPEQEDRLKVDLANCFLGENIFIDGILARVVTVFWTGDPEDLLLAEGDGEIEVVGWEKPENLLNYPLRTGVRNISQECL